MKQINPSAPVKCTRQIEINAPITKVWSIMQDINNWHKWQPDIRKPNLVNTLSPGAVFTWSTNGARITSTIHTLNPPHELGWTGKTYGMFAIHNWTFTKQNDSTLVSVHESMQGFLASLFKRTFNKNLERDMKNWLQYLKMEAENGAMTS